MSASTMARERREHLRRLTLAADASDAAVAITDDNDHVVFVNRGFGQMFGWQPDEVMGQSLALLLPKDAQSSGTADLGWLQPGGPPQSEDIVVGKEGQRYWAKILRNPVFDASRRDSVYVLTDITSAKVHEAFQLQALEAMARERPLAEVLTLICREIERIAPELTVSVLEIDEQRRLHPLAAPGLPQSYCDALDGLAIGPSVGSCGTAAWRNEAVRVDDIASDPLWQDYRDLALPCGFRGCWSTPIPGSDGTVAGVFAFYFRQPREEAAQRFHQRLVDACAQLCTLAFGRERARQRIRQLAFYDDLTGLANRSLLHARADQLMADSSLQGDSMAVLFIDLDRFKQVNDTLGHAAGDDLLRQVARRLQRDLPAAHVLGRLAGDEFALVIGSCNQQRAALMAERLQERLADPVLVLGSPLPVSASIGIAMFPADGRDVETLLQRADVAMWQSRAGGRGRFGFFSREMDQLAQERLTLEAALRQALYGGHLRLHYQPQVELESGRLYGVEALARWHHPVLGHISPVRFIPLAEESGLIVELGRWVLREACAQLAAWRADGLEVPSISVNMSPTCFHHSDLPRRIEHTLQRHGLAARDLILEITESVLLDTHPDTMRTVHDVHAMGVRLSMDDFGTGYSSLSYLRRLPVSELKLDRSFVADLEHDEAARTLSRAILGIGRSLQLAVVAEGVETEAQQALLREQGYPVAQGYGFSPPLAPEALAAWIRQRA